ncbi:MAG: hypothetical protein IJT28_00015 [Bacteroidaceae bacterium]|jgi:hypothetical protein|nr:hypothetical protein [Bacteroidaceae bacterium]
MKKTVLSIIVPIFGLLMAWVSCVTKKMPEAELVGIRYSNMGMIARPIYEGEMIKNEDGEMVLRAMKESYGPLFEKRLTKEEVQHFREIIEEEKMYAYKERYLPSVTVFDGEMWGFDADFADGSSIGSHGSNAWPKGNGLGRIRSYMEELVQDGVQIEFPEEELY